MRATLALHDVHRPNDLVAPRPESSASRACKTFADQSRPHDPLLSGDALGDPAPAANLPPLDVRRAAPQSGQRFVLQCVVETVLTHGTGPHISLVFP